MSKGTIYLHAGLHKTATSSIQATCHNSREELLRQGVLYPACLGQDHSRFIDIAFKPMTKVYRVDIDVPLSHKGHAEQGRKLKQALVDEVAGSSFTNLLISGESMSTMAEDQVPGLRHFLVKSFPDFDIKILFCTREYDSFRSSLIQQRIKGGEKASIRLRTDIYRWGLEKFIKNFGKKNILVYSFEEACAHRDGPVGFFLETLGLETSGIPLLRVNEAASDKAVDLLAYINDQIPSRDGWRKSPFRTFNDTGVLQGIRGKKFVTRLPRTPEDDEAIRQDIEWLKSAFGIDYTQSEWNPDIHPIVYDGDFCKDIVYCFPRVPRNIQVCIHRYLVQRAEEREGAQRTVLLQTLDVVKQLTPGLETMELEPYPDKPQGESGQTGNGFAGWMARVGKGLNNLLSDPGAALKALLAPFMGK